MSKDQGEVFEVHISDVGKRPQGIKKQQAVRKSAHSNGIENLREQFASQSDYIQELQAPLSPPASSRPEGKVCVLIASLSTS